MSTIAFVPVRCGSKSIPFKNIKPLHGRPLVFWTLQALQQAEKIDRIVVATDCDEIIDTVKNYGFNKTEIYNRSTENAADESSTESVMLEYLSKHKPDNNDLFILVQATSPFTQATDFNRAIDQYINTNADSLLTCCRIKRFFWSADGTALNYNYQQRPRRQDFSGTLVENGAFYISSVKNITESKNRLSGKISIYEMPEYTFTELDEPEDWKIAEHIMQKLPGNIYNTKQIKIVLSDIDGVLTDAGMYYSENGDELKKFSTYDGMGFKLLQQSGLKTGLITQEDRQLNKRRAEKLKLDFLYQGIDNKLAIAKEICQQENISLNEVAYIGDDINDFELLSHVGVAACPANAASKIKSIPGIVQLSTAGGSGVFREFAEFILKHKQ
ncbi:MAG: acylneuraminate cytidylyltransferase [Cyclobacteriaceae bacterium]|nr:acylneuraminate cytidylyltransferase [Cyclobacteriaceae bacterium]